MCKRNSFKIVTIFLIFTLFMSNIFALEIPKLYCKSAILMDLDSGRILYGINENKKVYPASTTKVLTAILALESLDISSSTVVSSEAVKLPYASSNAALKQGEVMTITDLLYALMLKSGNDAANVLAEAVSGSINEFVILMNKKAKEIGCTNTHFANAHGYHDNNHYTTPVDMMKILSYAVKNEQFVKIFSTREYTINKTNKTNQNRIYQNTNRLILTKEDSYLSRYYEYCIGGKTGYTDEAGRTLVAYAKKDDKNLLLGVFNSNPSGIEDLRYTDSINLFEYGFNNFEKSKILEKSDYSFSYENTENDMIYSYSLADDIFTLTNTEENSAISVVKYDVSLDYDALSKYDINTEDYKNQVVGSIKIEFSQNSSIYDKEYDLVLQDIEQIPWLNRKGTQKLLTNILICIVCVLVFVILLKIFIKTLKKKKKKTKPTISSRYIKRNVNYKSRRKRQVK